MRQLIVICFAALALPATAQASQYALKPHHHCKAHYVRKLERVKVKKHGQVVRVKEIFCVHIVPKAPSNTTTTTTTTASTPPTPAPTPAPQPPAKAVHAEISLWDPINTANPEFEKPKSGYRFIAIELRLTNVGSETINDNANIDTNVVGTDTQVYTTSFNERKGCTDFAYGSFTLSPGASVSGCVVFELPEAVKAAKVQFGLNGNVEDKWSIEGR